MNIKTEGGTSATGSWRSSLLRRSIASSGAPRRTSRDDAYEAAARYVGARRRGWCPLSDRRYRAYDTTTEWMGEARPTIDAADRDAKRHNDGCAKQGGYGSAIVVTQSDPSDTWPTCVDLEGKTVWPPHGRTSGAVRWPTK